MTDTCMTNDCEAMGVCMHILAIGKLSKEKCDSTFAGPPFA